MGKRIERLVQAKMSMVEIHCLKHFLLFQINELHSVLDYEFYFILGTTRTTPFCFGLANCYFAERGAKREKKKLNHPVRDKNRENYSAGSRELSGTYGS